MRKTSIILIVLFCILFIYIITIQTIKGCTKRSFRKRVERLHNLDVSSNIIRDRLSGVGIYYINLNKATDRRKNIDTFIQKYNIDNIQRIEGVYGKDIKDNTYTFSDGREIQVKNEYSRNEYSMAELGCFLSHVVALKTAYENGDEYALILEDDVDMNMVKVWDEGIKEVIQKAPDNWNIIQLFEIVKSWKYILYTFQKENTYIPRNSQRFVGAMGYIIRKRAIEKFLLSLNCLYTNNVNIIRKKSTFPIDVYMYDFFQPDTVHTTKSKFIVNNIQNGSQIQLANNFFLKLFAMTLDEKMMVVCNRILKIYNL